MLRVALAATSLLNAAVGLGLAGWFAAQARTDPDGVPAVAILAALALYTQVEVRRAEARFPPVGQFVTADGLRLHYVDRGAGPPVVLLHGNPGFVEDFLPVADSLARSHRVVAFDRPGHGYSARASAAGTTARSQVRLIHHALARLGVRRPILVGHSWGGGLALLYALEYPADVDRLVLIGTRAYPSAGGTDPVYALSRTPILGALFRHTVLLPIGRTLLDRRLAAAYAPDTVRRDHWQEARALWLRPAQAAATVWDARNLDRELRGANARYAAMRVPVIVLCGERDELLPESKRLSAAIPGAQLVVLPNTGHEAQLTRTSDVISAIRRRPSGPSRAVN
jgi:pimeloyl-ACP methyl ester carboxylesterase